LRNVAQYYDRVNLFLTCDNADLFYPYPKVFHTKRA
jgi:hypothetical protein